jgi:hypothetical protein
LASRAFTHSRPPSKLLAEQLAPEDIRVRLELFANLIRVFD